MNINIKIQNISITQFKDEVQIKIDPFQRGLFKSLKNTTKV